MIDVEGYELKKPLVRTPAGFLGDTIAQNTADDLNEKLKKRLAGQDFRNSDVPLGIIQLLGRHRKVPYVRSIFAKFIGISRDTVIEIEDASTAIPDESIFHTITSGVPLTPSVKNELSRRLDESEDDQTTYAIGYLMAETSTELLSVYHYNVPRETTVDGEERTIQEQRTLLLDPGYDSTHRF